MSIEQTSAPRGVARKRSVAGRHSRTTIKRLAGRVLAILAVFVLLGGSALPAAQARMRAFTLASAGWGFNLLEWEADALARKARDQIQRPAARLDGEVGSENVRAYLARAQRLGELEDQLVALASLGTSMESAQAVEIRRELDELRALQDQARPAVEQVVESQIGEVLVGAEFGLGSWPAPPVQFTFTEAPRKLVVSPRDRIDIVYGRMLDAEIPLASIEQIEARVREEPNAVGYVTEIGGLGAYPTIVIDRASLRWVLSTVAHEWVHNYLVFFPLGWNYFKSQELTTMNETVAEIVGNEIGDAALSRYYADAAAPPPSGSELVLPNDGRPFDFRAEMRETRLEVDRLLADGQVAEAEDYMERRRKEFVEQGYPLRVLNQAYFAFHGSYGTSAASTSPIGPKLERLRDLAPDLATFLKTVRGFTSVEDLDDALSDWGGAQ